MATQLAPSEIMQRASAIAFKAFGSNGPAKLLDELAERAPTKTFAVENPDDEADILNAAAELCKRPAPQGGFALPDGGPALVLEHLAALRQHASTLS